MKSNNNIQEQEDQELTHIICRVKFVHHLSSEAIQQKDMINIIKKSLNCTETEADNYYTQIKKLLNKDNKEIIRIDTLGKEIQRRYNDIVSDALSDFFNSFYLSILSKSEGIVYRLKLLSKCSWISKKNNFGSSIEYILTTITEGDLYDLDLAEISQHIRSRDSTKFELGSLVQYSQIESSNQREKDFIIIRSASKRYTNAFNYSSIHSNSSANNLPKKRRSTNLTTIVSPSILARIYTQICKIDQVDFNIFDLDEIVGKKATVYVANEILSKLYLVENEMIPPEILANFINEIVDNYDRVNASYHNDLHAGDVMQTLFTIIIKGNLQEVSLLLSSCFPNRKCKWDNWTLSQL